MSPRALQEELDKERAIVKAAKDRIALQNKEIAALKAQLLQNRNDDAAREDVGNYLVELMDHLPQSILMTDETGNRITVNTQFCRQFGFSTHPDGMSLSQVLTKTKDAFDDPAKFIAKVTQALTEKRKILNEELKMDNGLLYGCDFIPLYTNKAYRGHIIKFTDVTRNKTIGDTFDTQRKFYEQILNNIPADIAVFSADHRYLFVNPVAVSNPDLRKWIIGKTHDEYCAYTSKPASIAETRKKVLDTVINTKTKQEWEEKFVRANGQVDYFVRIMYPVLNDHGDVEMVIAYGITITERKKIEEQIQLSEKRYRDLFNFSQAWICTHDLKGRLFTINPAACHILGYESHELLGRTIDSLMPEKHRANFAEAYLDKITKDGKAEGILSVVSRQGQRIYLLYQNFLVNEPGGDPYVIGFAQNITQRIYAEEALKRSEEKYKGLIENMNLGMMELDDEERIIYANQRFCTMSGYDISELREKKATDLFLKGASVLKRTRTQLSKGHYSVDNSYEFAVKTKSGEERWWLTTATPLLGPGDVPKGTISVHLDITEKKKLEEQLKLAKAEADRSSRSKDLFLTNMSHEIRTPLNAIMGLGRLLSKSELDIQQKNYLNGIESASTNLLNIINDLLDFSKIEAGKITIEQISFNLESISRQAVSVLTHKADEKGLVLSSEIDPRIAPVLIGDPYRINQVLMNMLSNAIKFTEKGSVYIKAFLLEESEGEQKILVVIEDTGVGIKEEYLKTIFDKFTQEDETVVRKFGGTGLGISITLQLMELMGGTIKVDSKKNVGTTISLTFRFKIGTARVFEKKRTIKNDTGSISGKKILLVEDNALNRLLAYTILTDYGATIIEAENGQQAVDLMRVQQFDIVLMDIQMPVMDGIQATQIIRREISKTVPILALTANAIKGKEHEFTEAGMNDLIFKPYNEINLVNPIGKWLVKGDDNPQAASPAAPQAAAPPPQPAAPAPPPKFEPPAPTAPVSPGPVPAATSQSAARVPAGPLYDLSKLLAMGRNDPSFITKMLRLFIDETPPCVVKIKEGYMVGDLKTIRYYAHRMKPSITNLGINSLKEDILKLEFIEDNDPNIEHLISKLDNVINGVVEQMKAEYNLK